MDEYSEYILGLTEEQAEWEGALDPETFWAHYFEKKGEQ